MPGGAARSSTPHLMHPSATSGVDRPAKLIGIGPARPADGRYDVMRVATSYFATEVRRPGVSPVGIESRISSPRL